jgi:hypothetical protein
MATFIEDVTARLQVEWAGLVEYLRGIQIFCVRPRRARSAAISDPGQDAVIALAGRRIDPEPADEPRFPFARVPAVRDAIAARFRSERARTLVCSAACGADLVALEVAQERGLRTRIILPFSASEFRKTSVVDRPRAEFWGRLFDLAIAKARETNDVVDLGRAADDANAYSAATRAIVAEAKRLAGETVPPSNPVAMLIWNGAPRGASDNTKEFADLAAGSGFRVIEVQTLET